MGTRNLTCVVADGEFKVAQYGQWDGYPSGQGATVYRFLKANADRLDEFKALVSSLPVVTDADLENRWVECGKDPDSGWATIAVSSLFGERYPHLSRDCGAFVLELILAGEVDCVKLEQSFAASSLFCEWAYVLDLDRNVLEVYEGFVKEPHEGQRFSSLPRDEEEEYYPIKLLREFPFAELPATVEEYIEILEPAEEED